MNRRYVSGRNFEYRVKRYFSELGYYVWRSPASKSPADLLAIKKGSILLIQCKTNGVFPKEEQNGLSNLAKRIEARPLLASRNGKNLIISELA